MWQAVQTGHVTHADALACGEGLRYGFTCGVDITKLQGYLTFENYQSAIGAGEAVIKDHVRLGGTGRRPELYRRDSNPSSNRGSSTPRIVGEVPVADTVGEVL